jgi:hypothetical protein
MSASSIPIQVDVRPLQGQRLATAQAGVHQQLTQGPDL